MSLLFNRIEQCFASRCSHLSTILNNIVEPELGVTILFNIVDNCEHVRSKTLFNPVCCNNLIVFSCVI